MNTMEWQMITGYPPWLNIDQLLDKGRHLIYIPHRWVRTSVSWGWWHAVQAHQDVKQFFIIAGIHICSGCGWRCWLFHREIRGTKWNPEDQTACDHRSNEKWMPLTQVECNTRIKLTSLLGLPVSDLHEIHHQVQNPKKKGIWMPASNEKPNKQDGPSLYMRKKSMKTHLQIHLNKWTGGMNIITEMNGD